MPLTDLGSHSGIAHLSTRMVHEDTTPDIAAGFMPAATTNS